MALRRSPTHKGVFRRCACPSTKTSCGHWSFSVELKMRDGKRVQKFGSKFESAAAANKARNKLVVAADDDELPSDDKITLGQWLAKWLKEREGELRPSTYRSYKDLTNMYLIPNAGDVTLAKLKPRHLTTAYRKIVNDRNAAIKTAQEKREQGLTVTMPRSLSATTIRRIHAVASAALVSARKGGIIRANPAEDAELPKAEKHKVQPWTPEQYEAFLYAIRDERLHPAFHLFGHSGLRRGELAGLQWSDVDLTAGTLTVNRSRVSVGFEVLEGDAKSEAGQGREIPLDADTIDILMLWASVQLEERLNAGDAYSDERWVFTDELGKPYHPEYFSKTFRRLSIKHGLPVVKLHALRHYFAAAMISSGKGEATVSYLLGHSSVQVTVDIYGSLFKPAAKAATEGVADMTRKARAAREAMAK